jgi:hypothetical protein
VNSAGCVLATAVIVDPIAVADIAALLRAISPDGVLNEPGKAARIASAEFSRVDSVSNELNNVRALTWPVTRDPVQVLSTEPAQDSRPAQKIVNQRVNRDQAGARFMPIRPVVWGSEQNGRECHRDHGTLRNGAISASRPKAS